MAKKLEVKVRLALNNNKVKVQDFMVPKCGQNRVWSIKIQTIEYNGYAHAKMHIDHGIKLLARHPLSHIPEEDGCGLITADVLAKFIERPMRPAIIAAYKKRITDRLDNMVLWCHNWSAQDIELMNKKESVFY